VRFIDDRNRAEELLVEAHLPTDLRINDVIVRTGNQIRGR
jgi:hypothetical protein